MNPCCFGSCLICPLKRDNMFAKSTIVAIKVTIKDILIGFVDFVKPGELRLVDFVSIDVLLDGFVLFVGWNGVVDVWFGLDVFHVNCLARCYVNDI